METKIYRYKKQANSRNSTGGSIRRDSNDSNGRASWRITNVSPVPSPEPSRKTASEVKIWHNAPQNHISRNSSQSSLYSNRNEEVPGTFRIMQSRSPTPEILISFPNQVEKQRSVLVDDIYSAFDANNRIAYWEIESDDSGLSEQEVLIPGYDFRQKALYPQVPVELILTMPHKVNVSSEPYHLRKLKTTNMPLELLQDERPESPLGYKRYLYMQTPPLPKSRLNELHEYDLVRVDNKVQIRKRGEAVADNNGIYSHHIEENSNFIPDYVSEYRSTRNTPLPVKKKVTYQDKPTTIGESFSEDSWVVYHSIPYTQRQTSYTAPEPLQFDIDHSKTKVYQSSEQRKIEAPQPPKKVKDLSTLEVKSVDTQVEIPDKDSIPDHFHYQYQDPKKEKQIVELYRATQEQERILTELKNEVKLRKQDLKNLALEKEKQRNEIYEEESKKLLRLQEELKKYEEERDKQKKQLEEEKQAYMKMQREEEEARQLKLLQEENKRLEEEKEKKRKLLDKERKELKKRHKEEQQQLKLLEEEYKKIEDEKEKRRRRLEEEKESLKKQREEEEVRLKLLEEENRRYLEEKERRQKQIEENKRYQEEMERRQKIEEENRRQQEEMKRRQKIEEENRRYQEEMERRQKIEEENRRQQEEIERRQKIEEENRRYQEEMERRQKIEENRRQQEKQMELNRQTLLQNYEREKEEKFRQHQALTQQNRMRLLELQKKNAIQEVKQPRKSIYDGFPESLKAQLKKFSAMQQRTSQRQKKNYTLFPISDSVQQTIDVKEEETEVKGMSLLFDEKPESYSESYNTVDERVSIKIEENNATIDVIIIYEVYNPTSLEEDIWQRQRVIITRLIFIDLKASPQTRKAFDRMVKRTLPNLKWTASETINLTGTDAYKLYNAVMSVVEDEIENSHTLSNQKSVTMDTLPHYLEAGYDQMMTSDDMIY